jgi:hypothetical protein
MDLDNRTLYILLVLGTAGTIREQSFILKMGHQLLVSSTVYLMGKEL